MSRVRTERHVNTSAHSATTRGTPGSPEFRHSFPWETGAAGPPDTRR